MATEVISNHRQMDAIDVEEVEEDVSTNSTDVEMLLIPTRDGKAQEQNGVVGSTGVVALADNSPSSEVVDGEKLVNGGGVSPNVHHHYHYHYFYHHHGGASAHHHHPNKPGHVMITAPAPGGDTTPSSVPSSPISPIPTSGDVSSQLSSQNTSALVRTISNGSTFGPINSNWPLFPPNTLAQLTATSQSTPEISRKESSVNAPVEPLNLSNNQPQSRSMGDTSRESPSVILNATANCHSSTSSPQLSPISPSSTSKSPVYTFVDSRVSTQSDLSSAMLTASSADPVIITPRNSPTPQRLAVTPISTTATTMTAILTTAIPAQTSLPNQLDLPLAFGEKYILTSQIEASNLYRCVNTHNMQNYCCKVVLSKDYTDFCTAHLRMDGHEGINQIQQIIVGRKHTFILFEPSFGDLHSYVRLKKRLRESEAMALFQQIVQVVADCHKNGIILRDLKLRKFIFANPERTQLKLETLEGASLFEDDDDTLMDKHGCPAYVSPEILYSNSYSGTLADCWSLGVILYTMLVGRYPFHDMSPSVVFCKIRRGTYHIPETLSHTAKCLIRNLIRIDPAVRLTAEDALAHRWFRSGRSHHLGGVWLKSHHRGSGGHSHHHRHSSLSAAAAAINHHHHHHHHHHTSSTNGSSQVHNTTSTPSSSSNATPTSTSPYNESFNDATSSSHEPSSPSTPTPLDPLGPIRFTLLSPVSNPEMRNNVRNLLSSPSTSTSDSTTSSQSHIPSNTSSSPSSICCHYLASMCDQVVPDLSPDEMMTNEEVVEAMSD